MTNNTVSDPDFLFPSSPSRNMITNFASSSRPDANFHQNARKKRSKLIKIDASSTSSYSASVSKPKYTKKPDPSAPKITRPCTECGKKFWSWKALFGHMRCHPERQWRGINPPPNLRRPVSSSPVEEVNRVENVMTVDDHEVAACLLILANGADGNGASASNENVQFGNTSSLQQGGQDNEMNLGVDCRFECTSCKKVFGSHQALGGHRASHKNVKGCFAITRSSEGCEIDQDHCSHGIVKESVDDERKTMMVFGHKCSICLRVFSSGQALGGHKRCHWEKGDDQLFNQGLNLCAGKESCELDLNLPAPIDDDSASSSYSSGLTLDLRLGL
ncbi:Zinc finger protein [Melia azedarach]|uniref:Zinc finger protein n=1 Tax=Melia azedarach TaxID=155640 RepID=A0ACC1XWM5_MELAZ|nr:Zinc finger protein [Melia azedarach]